MVFPAIDEEVLRGIGIGLQKVNAILLQWGEGTGYPEDG